VFKGGNFFQTRCITEIKLKMDNSSIKLYLYTVLAKCWQLFVAAKVKMDQQTVIEVYHSGDV